MINKVVWVFLAFAFGIMLFVSIQDKLPNELSFLKNDSTSAVTQPAAAQPKVSNLGGWTVRQQGPALEATRRFSGELTVGGTAYDVPEVGILCNAGKLDARIDTRMPTTGARVTRVALDGHAQDWDKGAGANIFPQSAADFVRYLAARPSVTVTLSYKDLGNQTTSLDTQALRQLLAAFPATCR